MSTFYMYMCASKQDYILNCQLIIPVRFSHNSHYTISPGDDVYFNVAVSRSTWFRVGVGKCGNQQTPWDQ